MRYGFRSFDRQWIIPDNRLIDRPNPALWERHSEHQVYITALTRYSPKGGPALTFTGLIPDGDHYKGSFSGRVFPLWLDRKAASPNVSPNLLTYLKGRYQALISAADFFAYIACIAAHPAYTSRFEPELVQPGLRIPLTADGRVFQEAAELGRTAIWLFTFGERFADPRQDRPPQPPRLPRGEAPRIPADGVVPQDPDLMPDTLDYDEPNRRLLIGQGYVERVTPGMWGYEVSGKQVLRHWFSYRKRNRERPIIGDRRTPSKLGDIQPDHWLAEYTSELINVLNVIGLLIKLEPSQAELLERICAGPTITSDELRLANAITSAGSRRGASSADSESHPLFD
jgi:Type ISP C-terminal specificity domain